MVLEPGQPIEPAEANSKCIHSLALPGCSLATDVVIVESCLLPCCPNKLECMSLFAASISGRMVELVH